MKLRRATQVSMLLLAVPVLACSMLRAHQPLPWHVTLEVDGSVQDRDAATKHAVVVDSQPIVDGSELRNATAVLAVPDSEDYKIAFSLAPNGAQKFGTWTSANINEFIAVVYNGEVKSIAYIKSTISDQGEISGRFTRQSAEDLALILNSGALPKVKIVEEG